jgi:hypothetical protein
LIKDEGTKSLNSDSLSLAAGSGVAGNPIVVTLKERKFLSYLYVCII